MKNQNDCDKFAIKKKTFDIMATQNQNLKGGIATGVFAFYYKNDKKGVWSGSGGHAVNFLVIYNEGNSKTTAVIYEPQTGEMFIPADYLERFDGAELGLLLM